MPSPFEQRKVVSKTERISNIVIGTLFAAVAVWLLVEALPQPSPGEGIAVLAIGSLGVEALVCALRGRRSLLSRIGPLP